MSRLLNILLFPRYLAAAGETGADTGGTGSGTGTTAEVVVEEETVETRTETVEDASILDMSDDEVMSMSAPPAPKAVDKPVDKVAGAADTDAAAAAIAAEKAVTNLTNPLGGDDDDDLDPDNPDKGSDGKVKATDKATGAAGEAGKSTQVDAAGADDKTKKVEGAEGAEGAEGTETAAKDTEVKTPAVLDDAGIKAFYAKITAPFKANGREIKIESPEDAIQLMQMGANYNKRMAALKPHLKMVRMLENNGLLNEEHLSFLIDVSKKDKSAISKLVKESGLDPMDLSADSASAYKPGSHAVSDTEVELDTVLEEVKTNHPKAYTQTLDVVTTKWDAASKQVIAASPQVLKVIATHIDAGLYDLITKEVENERLFGRLDGLSDIEAYRKVGDDMNAKGRFNHLGQGSSPATAASKPSEKVVVEPPKKVDDKDRNDKRRAASPAKPSPGASTRSADFNPLAMSDEEIAKMGNAKYL
jgi:hypothetical protein